MPADGRRDDWQTPAWLFDRLHSEFEFTVDAAASAGNAKVRRFWDTASDGLSQEWSGERVFCNPPYGAAVTAWTRKALHAARAGALSVLILPVRSESTWWAEHVLAASEIRFIRGRVHFEPPPGMTLPPGGSRPVFASAVVVFGRCCGLHVSSFPTPRVALALSQRRLPLVQSP